MPQVEQSPGQEWRSATRSLKFSYLWSFSAIGAFGSFVALYYRDLGFTGLEIGILVAIPPIAVAFFGPLWGTIADSQGAHRLVLRLALGVAALAALACTQVETFPAFVVLISLFALFSTPVNAILDSFAVSSG
ncbi:MAG: MFS transporter, partial [Verrucomicrobiales bacterium]